MLKLGSFFDSETDANYDLYSINAITIKKAIESSYKLSYTKIRMFDDDSQVLQDINRELKNSNLQFDKVTGKILNDDYASNKCWNIKPEAIDERTKAHYHIHTKNQQYYQLGFELLPIAVSLPNKDTTKLNQIELLDGFKRMFCSQVPDKDVLVKVYDILPTAKWCNAMLLFNAWKLIGYKFLFMDRGFKLGLWKHFGIDVTLHHNDYDHDIISLLHNFLGVNTFNVLKNNQYIDLDINLILDVHNHLKNEYISRRLAILLGFIRSLEIDNRENAKPFYSKDMIPFLKKDAAKHIKKLDSMSVHGFKENYAKKHVQLLLTQYIRDYYGYEGKVSSYPEFFDRATNLFKTIEEARIASLPIEIKGEIQF